MASNPHTANILSASRLLNELERPTQREMRSVQNYLKAYQPINNEESAYIQHTQDLITLRRSQDPDLISRLIERCLQKWRIWPLLVRVRPRYPAVKVPPADD